MWLRFINIYNIYNSKEKNPSFFTALKAQNHIMKSIPDLGNLLILDFLPLDLVLLVNHSNL